MRVGHLVEDVLSTRLHHLPNIRKRGLQALGGVDDISSDDYVILLLVEALLNQVSFNIQRAEGHAIRRVRKHLLYLSEEADGAVGQVVAAEARGANFPFPMRLQALQDGEGGFPRAGANLEDLQSGILVGQQVRGICSSFYSQSQLRLRAVTRSRRACP
jgi:hypothetical protein